MVFEFMKKKGLLARLPTSRLSSESSSDLTSNVLNDAALNVNAVESQLKACYLKVPRIIRAGFMVEELREVLDALAKADEVELADGLADLLYVVLGTAVQFEIPLQEVFEEVHRSNMSKCGVDERNPLLKSGKGATYSPPDVAGALARGRAR